MCLNTQPSSGAAHQTADPMQVLTRSSPQAWQTKAGDPFGDIRVYQNMPYSDTPFSLPDEGVNPTAKTADGRTGAQWAQDWERQHPDLVKARDHYRAMMANAPFASYGMSPTPYEMAHPGNK